jgi:hypothetical protein
MMKRQKKRVFHQIDVVAMGRSTWGIFLISKSDRRKKSVEKEKFEKSHAHKAAAKSDERKAKKKSFDGVGGEKKLFFPFIFALSFPLHWFNFFLRLIPQVGVEKGG